MKRSFIGTAALAGLLALPGVAHAASAIVTADLNLRTGPGANYRDVGTIPRGDNITVNSCLDRRNWCDITWRGARGWVSQSYVAIQSGARPAPRAAPRYRRAEPTVSFSFGVYDDSYRRHHRRDWRHHDRWDRRHDRYDRDWHRRDYPRW